jgi:hypothetical protein
VGITIVRNVIKKEYMKAFKSLDLYGTEPAMQKPLEEYPGFLGYEVTCSELVLGPEIAALNEINWRKYFELADESVVPLEIELKLTNKSIKFKPADMMFSLGNILDMVPSIEVQKDHEYGYNIFFLKNGYTYLQVEADIKELVKAVNGK